MPNLVNSMAGRPAKRPNEASFAEQSPFKRILEPQAGIKPANLAAAFNDLVATLSPLTAEPAEGEKPSLAKTLASTLEGQAISQSPRKASQLKPYETLEDSFCRFVIQFNREKGVETKFSTLGGVNVPYLQLFNAVMRAGGSKPLSEAKRWASIGRSLGVPDSLTDLSTKTKRVYIRTLHALEIAYAAGDVDLAPFVAEDAPEPSSLLPLPWSPPVKRDRKRKQDASDSTSAAKKVQETKEEAKVEVTTPKLQALQKRQAASKPRNGSLNAVGIDPTTLIGRRIGIWRPCAFPAAVAAAAGGNTSDSSDQPANGFYNFGVVVGEEKVPPYRQIIRYDNEMYGKRELVDLNEEIWIAVERPHPLPPVIGLGEEWKAAMDANTKSNNSLGGLMEQNSSTNAALEQVLAQQAAAAAAAAPATAPAAPARPTPKPQRPKPSPVPRAEDLLVTLNEHYSVYRTSNGPAGFEIYADFPNSTLTDVAVKCYRRGAVRLKAKNQNEYGLRTMQVHVVQLPERIDSKSAKALMTVDGQLYVRVNLEKEGGGRGGDEMQE